MKAGLSLFVSVVFHPLFINLLSLVLLFYLFPPLHYGFAFKVKLMLIGFIFVTTGLIPAAIIGIMKLYGRVSSILLADREERILPYLITASLYLTDFWICKETIGSGLLAAYLLASASVVVAVLIITFFNKISIHMAGFGALMGVIVAATGVAEFDVRFLLGAAVLLAGLTASARLFTNSHVPQQLYSGLLVGFAVMIAILP